MRTNRLLIALITWNAVKKEHKQQPQKPQQLKAEQVFTSVDIGEIISSIIEPSTVVPSPMIPNKKSPQWCE